ncbi:MAG: Leucine efflux protein [Candidatus Celerinatantimonas neptuna]|nr:MAG: Leucine efflux protein [Candidatus Celerinatantimonas neptuna]
MEFGHWLVLAAICLLGAMSPGPSLAMVVHHTMSSGRKGGLVAAWTHTTGIAFYASLTVLGLAAVLIRVPVVFKTVSLLGAIYLIWLGGRALFAHQQNILITRQSIASSSVYAAARDGFAISLLNPKILLFFTALFSPFIGLEQMTNRPLLVITPFLIDGCWYSLVVFLLSQAGVLKWLRSHGRWLDRMTGIILLGLGCAVMISSFSSFR